MDSDAIIIIIFMLVFAWYVTLAILFFIVSKKSNAKAQEAELIVNQILSQIPPDRQSLFMMQYQNVKKNPTTSMLLALFLGGLGAHKFYLNQPGVGILFLLFSWTTIPGIIGVIEAFSIAGKVGEMNLQKARELSILLA